MKTLRKFVGYPLTLIFGGSAVSAGGLAPVAIEPQVEAVIVDEGKSSSMGVLPILALLALVALLASQRDNDEPQAKKKVMP